jgi:hypothetical protein
LRQNFDGATFWIELDDDGDSTFIINSEVIDLDRSPNAIASFAAGNYVVEANIFGFDRGSFDLSQDFRLVMTRERSEVTTIARIPNANATGATSPAAVVPGPTLTSDEIAINFSRTPYQGDAWGSQTSQVDTGYKPGPLTSGNLYQVTSTTLDYENLTRPNQKALEVLSSVGFVTTLGTGRLSGDMSTSLDPRNVGWEDNTTYFPPTSGVDARPRIEVGALHSEESIFQIGSEYHGCTERLPLGSYWRDKDFRGGIVTGAGDSGFRCAVQAPVVYTKDMAPAMVAGGVAAAGGLDQTEAAVTTASLASGQPGEIVVHVDGEQGNFGLTTNFRTNRGGSVFAGSGDRPGGELVTLMSTMGTHPSRPGVLSGIAMLVRNYLTTVGANEVSAGSELMMLIVTHGDWLKVGNRTVRSIICGANGSGEGFSAADLYRIEGRPLLRDHVRMAVDPDEIVLNRSLVLEKT